MSLEIQEIEVVDYERVIYAQDPEVGLYCFIAVHSTVLGPALGGVRIHPYASKESALKDVLRLSKGMTYKAALAECGLGGGKSVIILDPRHKSEAILHRFAELVNLFQGNYFCAEDSGCTPADVITMRQKTPYVMGLSLKGSSGNPSPYTAWGTLRSMQATMQYLNGSSTLHGKVVAIQGVGAVGYQLAEMLFWEGADLIVSDLFRERAQEVKEKFGATIVDSSDILETRCDILAPCAMGAILNINTIDSLHCRAVVGCANNQLEFPEDAHRLKRKGITYAPDFLVNAGGLINVQMEMDKKEYSPLRARSAVDKIYNRLISVYEIAEKNQYTTDFAAVQLAKHRLRYGIGKRIEAVQIQHDPLFV
jgi:leucine dehydrogenase